MMPGIGDALPGYSHAALVDSHWTSTDAVTLPDVRSRFPGTFSVGLGEEGRPSSHWYMGGNGARDRVTADGVPVGSPLFADDILSMYPIEFVNALQDVHGPDALLLGARWNLRTHQYASPDPKTAIRFVQRPFETIFTDGWYSQNVARSTNLLFGFQRRTSDGRFDNAALNSWNLRGRLRYNITPWLNVMGTWSYEKTSRGTNGGIDRARSALLFDEVSASVIDPQAYEIRTHTALSFHALADLLGDSLSLTRLIVATIDEEREFNRPVASFYRPPAREFALTGATSVKLEQALSLGYVLVRGMAEYRQESSVDSSVLSAAKRGSGAVGGALEARFSDFIIPSAGFRVDDAPEGTRTSAAAALHVRLPGGLSLRGSYERRFLFPGMREAAWTDSLLLLPVQPQIGAEQFTSVKVRWQFMEGSFISAEAFRRDQQDVLFYFRDTTASGTQALRGSYDDFETSGFQVEGLVTLGTISAGGWLSLLDIGARPVLASLLPNVIAGWEVGWKDRIFRDELGLSVRVRGSFYDRHAGFAYDPRTGLFTAPSEVLIGRMTRLDGFVALDIGNAVVTLSWENILNTDYFMVGTYPMFGRRFSLGVRWNFLD